MATSGIKIVAGVIPVSHAKNPEDRQRRNMPAVLGANAPTGLTVPPTPARLSARLRRRWEGLWTSPVAQLLDPVSDLPAVTRLFDLYRLEEQLSARLAEHLAAMAIPRTPGCDNLDCACEQHVEVPTELDASLASARLKVAGEIRMVESALGMSPRSRLALGLALLAGGRKGGGSLDDAAHAAGGDE